MHARLRGPNNLLMFQRCIAMRRFYISYTYVKMTFSLPRAYAVFCGRLNIAVTLRLSVCTKTGKLASASLQRF